jgi:hypothetical protein
MSNQLANARQVTFQGLSLPYVVIPNASMKYTMISERIPPGIDHPPINAWLKAKDTGKLQLLYNNADMAGMLVFTKHDQVFLLPVVAPTKLQSLTQNNKMIVNFGNEANKMHPVNIDTKDILKYVLGIMTEEDVKSCKFAYDNIDLHEPLKVTAANGPEKIWSLTKLPEDDNQADEDDPNYTPKNPNLSWLPSQKHSRLHMRTNRQWDPLDMKMSKLQLKVLMENSSSLLEP